MADEISKQFNQIKSALSGWDFLQIVLRNCGYSQFSVSLVLCNGMQALWQLLFKLDLRANSSPCLYDNNAVPYILHIVAHYYAHEKCR